MVGLALATTALSLVNRWFGSVIGEGIIYDLRSALYDHVQRMPVAFFTRTQTGSLMSRLTNDVLDAQNAVGTVASVVSDVMTLAATLVPMFVLSPWHHRRWPCWCCPRSSSSTASWPAGSAGCPAAGCSSTPT